MRRWHGGHHHGRWYYYRNLRKSGMYGRWECWKDAGNLVRINRGWEA